MRSVKIDHIYSFRILFAITSPCISSSRLIYTRANCLSALNGCIDEVGINRVNVTRSHVRPSPRASTTTYHNILRIALQSFIMRAFDSQLSSNVICVTYMYIHVYIHKSKELYTVVNSRKSFCKLFGRLFHFFKQL